MFGIELVIGIVFVIILTILSVGMAEEPTEGRSRPPKEKEPGLYEIIFGNKPDENDSRRYNPETKEQTYIPKPGEIDNKYSGAGLDQQIQDGPVDDAARLLGAIFHKYGDDEKGGEKERKKFEPQPVDWPTYNPPTEPEPPVIPTPEPIPPEPQPTQEPIVINNYGGEGGAGGEGGRGYGGEGGKAESKAQILNYLHQVMADYKEKGEDTTNLVNFINYVKSNDGDFGGKGTNLFVLGDYNETGGILNKGANANINTGVGQVVGYKSNSNNSEDQTPPIHISGEASYVANSGTKIAGSGEQPITIGKINKYKENSL